MWLQHWPEIINHLLCLCHYIQRRVWPCSWCRVLMLLRQKTWVSTEAPREVKFFSSCTMLLLTATINNQWLSSFEFFMTFSPLLVWVDVLKLQPEGQQKQRLMLFARSLSLSAWKSPSLPNYHQMVSCNSCMYIIWEQTKPRSLTLGFLCHMKWLPYLM